MTATKSRGFFLHRLHLPPRLARLLRIVVYIGLITFAVLTVAAALIYSYGQTDHVAPADLIIILGSGTYPDGSATVATARRVQHGAALYKQGLAPYILCTGGYTGHHPRSEAEACAEVARNLGVPDQAILMEEHSTSTEENAIEARKVMDGHGFKSAVLVSDNFHLYRAEIMFHAQNITVFLSPAQITSGTLGPRTALLGTYREVLALAWYEFKTALKLPVTSTK